MKELSVEEKAKRYDEALERTRELYSQHWVEWSDKDIESIFPELKESEDEKIRKEILEVAETVVSRDGTLYGKKYNCREWIAWLEKQVEPKEYTFKSLPRLLDMIEPTSKAKAYCQKLIDTLAKEGYNTDVKIVEEVLKGWNGDDVPMATMDEQKPVDNIEPKFKVGDWITDGNNALLCVEKFEIDYGYELKATDGQIFHFVSPNFVDANYHLWTIQDAKDGDVLREDSCTFIIERMNPDGTAIVYCCLFDDGDFDSGSTLSFDIDSTKPATKEQCDFFFQKMKEKSYEWNVEKKELKKIKYRVCDEDKAEMDYCFTKMMNGEKVSPKDEEYNGEDYGIDSLYHAQRILEKTLGSVDGYQTDDGILSHKCAITAIKKLYKQKSKEWSKEDEKMFDYALDMIEWYSGKNGDKSKLVSDWLKSLKDRVLPKQEWSEEDEERIKNILSVLDVQVCWNGATGKKENPYQKEINWLKSLKDRAQPQNWTKEDKERYISCLQRLGTGNPDQPETINSKWFKEHVTSLPQWKPNKKQMHFLNWLANVKLGDSVVEQEVSKNLNELYNDLTKL